MTRTQQPEANWYAPIHEALQREFTIVDCPDCHTVDDPADCPTCAGERVVVTNSRLVVR